ncbi:hypothetical protein [Saccharopolyspora shandongensis]|uniref:hypothetical protein n=1 Tax=Saccharopolyspora shandongensis TaxID=418495 RepID=UPI0033F16F40
MLEQKIRERRQTLEEFAEYAERFAREHNEAGTLGVRHLQRLASGRGPKGQPLGLVRPATARLLEHILGLSIEELLAPPSAANERSDDSAELRQLLHASRRIDGAVLGLLREQLTSIRRLDRQLGAVVAYDEVCVKAGQVGSLLTHSLPGERHEQLAALLSELHTLAGWQALDLGKSTESWQHYEQAKRAARESSAGSFEVHTAAEQAFVLLDIGETRAAVELLAVTRQKAEATCSRLLKAWLAAAHGEALAAHNLRDDSLRAFDTAAELLPAESTDPEGPYVVLDSVHLARWRGHALARFADPEAVKVLSAALDGLDASFTRAETALRVDLATAFAAVGEREAVKAQIDRAEQLASTIGSARQQQRIRTLTAL